MHKSIPWTPMTAVPCRRCLTWCLEVLCCIQASNGLRAQTPVDYYISDADGSRVKLDFILDQIGVVLMDGVQPDELNSFLNEHKLKFTSDEVDEIRLLQAQAVLDRAQLETIVRRMNAWNDLRDKKVVRYAGLLVKTAGATVPMLLTAEFVVEFQDDVNPEFIAGLNDKYKVKIVRKNPFRQNQFLLRSTEESKLGFLDVPMRYYETGRAKFAHPNFVQPKESLQAIPNDPLFGQQWHHENTGQNGGTVDADIDTPLAWEITTGDDNLIIAVIDNGFAVYHPDLIPNLWTNPGDVASDGIDNDVNGFVDDIRGWDFRDNDNTLDPSNPMNHHGTMVSGCVGARGSNSIGVSGSCQRCRLMLIKYGRTQYDDAEAFDYTRTMGASIITNSWRYKTGTISPVVENAVNDAATLGRGRLGCVVLFSMSNKNAKTCVAGTDFASIDNVISVSRATNQDRYDNSGFGNCMDLLGPTRSDTPTSAGGPFGTLGITTTVPGGYIDDFGGTSAATPITAGVAGLMLSVAPSLTRLQVQRGLQDTADKIEPSRGAYCTKTGFSHPASGDATHGFGRVNAFEAVRMVAPVNVGGRAGVDIMLRDNRLDWGNTEQLSSVVFEPTRGFIPHWECVDIKVDAPPLKTAPVTSADFDSFVDEDPLAADTNRVYVRVRNRGPLTASSVSVKLHWAFAGTALPSLPSDFWTVFPADSSVTTTWHPLNVQTITGLQYSGASVAGQGTADAAQVVGFDFPAPPLDSSQPAFQHYCLFCVIDSAQDHVIPPAASPLVPDFITPRNNNISQRNLILQPPLREGRREVRFFARNPSRQSLNTMLQANAPEGWSLRLSEGELGKSFELKAGEERLLTLGIAPNDARANGAVVLTQFDLSGQQPVVNGGCTIRVAPQERTALEDVAPKP